MAAGTLPKPGSTYGPCAGECKHLDCKETREMAAAPCIFCHKPIGYDTPFFQELGERRYTHAVCLYNAEEKGQQGGDNRYTRRDY